MVSAHKVCRLGNWFLCCTIHARVESNLLWATSSSVRCRFTILAAKSGIWLLDTNKLFSFLSLPIVAGRRSNWLCEACKVNSCFSLSRFSGSLLILFSLTSKWVKQSTIGGSSNDNGNEVNWFCFKISSDKLRLQKELGSSSRRFPVKSRICKNFNCKILWSIFFREQDTSKWVSDFGKPFSKG